MNQGIFQTTLTPIYVADLPRSINLKMETMNVCSILVKKNDEVVDEVTLAEGALAAQTIEGLGDVPNARTITISLEAGDTISAQAEFSDTITYTITE